MAEPQVLLKHDVTGHTALFPAAADMATWNALGWHPIPEAAPTDPAEEAPTDPAEEAPKPPRRTAAARTSATETEENA